MNVKTLPDSELLSQTKLKVLAERKITLEVIEHLREIERRKLYAHRGFSSLFTYCTKELGYAESEAYRRISAMNLVKKIPEVAEKIQAGSLTLTNVVQAARFFKSEEKRNETGLTLEKKTEILMTLENKSTRGAEKHLRSQSPLPFPQQEKIRILSDEHLEVKVILDKELQAKLEELRSLLSHKNPNMTYKELVLEIANIALKKLKPRERLKPSILSKARCKPPYEALPEAQSEVLSKAEAKPKSKAKKAEDHQGGLTKTLDKPNSPAQRTDSSALEVTAQNIKPKNSRYIPRGTKATVWKRDQARCTYVDPETKRKCESKHLLQYDHIYPFALGGTSEVQNIRLFCFKHNQLRTQETF